METKHTPGPWFLDNAEGGDWFRYVMAEDSQIGRVDLGNRGFISQHGEANARLIAAAPEMYEAIAAIATAMNLGYIPNEILSEGSPILEGLRAAIAKAEGK